MVYHQPGSSFMAPFAAVLRLKYHSLRYDLPYSRHRITVYLRRLEVVTRRKKESYCCNVFNHLDTPNFRKYTPIFFICQAQLSIGIAGNYLHFYKYYLRIMPKHLVQCERLYLCPIYNPSAGGILGVGKYVWEIK